MGRVLSAVHEHYQGMVSTEDQMAAMQADVRLRKMLQVGPYDNDASGRAYDDDASGRSI